MADGPRVTTEWFGVGIEHVDNGNMAGEVGRAGSFGGAVDPDVTSKGHCAISEFRIRGKRFTVSGPQVRLPSYAMPMYPVRLLPRRTGRGSVQRSGRLGAFGPMSRIQPVSRNLRLPRAIVLEGAV